MFDLEQRDVSDSAYVSGAMSSSPDWLPKYVIRPLKSPPKAIPTQQHPTTIPAGTNLDSINVRHGRRCKPLSGSWVCTCRRAMAAERSAAVTPRGGRHGLPPRRVLVYLRRAPGVEGAARNCNADKTLSICGSADDFMQSLTVDSLKLFVKVDRMSA